MLSCAYLTSALSGLQSSVVFGLLNKVTCPELTMRRHPHRCKLTWTRLTILMLVMQL